MCLKKVILSLILIKVVAKCFVEGLQCYVCEDCNEYEDFKELHICGEVPIATTIKPILLPAETESHATLNSIVKPSKPPSKPSTAYYLYEDSDDNSSQNSEQQRTTKRLTTATTTATQSATTAKFTTQKSTSVGNNPITENPTTLTEGPIAQQNTTTVNIQQEFNAEFSTENKRTTASTLASATSTKPKPTTTADYEDYLDYEDPIKEDRRSVKSLMKINDPVCYMIKYQANNTIFTKRGCTNFINGNKYLTCQSLLNGAHMPACRFCSTNGCNKFLDDDDGHEDNHGVLLNAAGVAEYFSFLVSILWVLVKYFLL